MKAQDIRKVGENELLLIWEDGARTLFSAPYIQLSCKCAHCVDEWTGERLVTSKDIDDQVKILSFEAVGNYAVKFTFSSGCQSGIYGFDYLYSIIPSKTAQ